MFRNTLAIAVVFCDIYEYPSLVYLRAIILLWKWLQLVAAGYKREEAGHSRLEL